MMVLQQLLPSLLNRPKPLLPPPHPSSLLPKQDKSRIIQSQELFPNNPLPLLLLHPQLVAVKSLIVKPPNVVYGLSYEREVNW